MLTALHPQDIAGLLGGLRISWLLMKLCPCTWELRNFLVLITWNVISA
jgi:hypothetical protein